MNHGSVPSADFTAFTVGFWPRIVKLREYVNPWYVAWTVAEPPANVPRRR
jgi:hypothetical protein